MSAPAIQLIDRRQLAALVPSANNATEFYRMASAIRTFTNILESNWKDVAPPVRELVRRLVALQEVQTDLLYGDTGWWRFFSIMNEIRSAVKTLNELEPSSQRENPNDNHSSTKKDDFTFMDFARDVWNTALQDPRALKVYHQAVSYFQETVSACIEREHPDYQTKIDEALDVNMEKLKLNPARNKDDLRSWLQF